MSTPPRPPSATTERSSSASILPASTPGTLPRQDRGYRWGYGSDSRAFQWTASAGSTDLNQLLTAAGTDLAGTTIVAATSLSSDGTWIGGAAVTPTTPAGETDVVLASLTYTPPAQTSRLLNLSTRGQALTADNVLIPGFVISGSANKRLLIRAVGPTLGHDPYKVSGTLPNPRMVLKRNVSGVYQDFASNDDWGTNSNAAAITQTAADLFAFPFEDDREAALLVDLPPGIYTAIVDGVGGATGVSIIELYDADDAATDSRLINISTRGFAGPGDQVMIPGFVISSESARTLLIRVVGPSLPLAPHLVDPKLELYQRETDGTNTLVATQDNWGDEPDAATTASVGDQVFAFPLTAGSKDAAFVRTLPPGTYTAIGSSAIDSSVPGGTGLVLVEVYVVP